MTDQLSKLQGQAALDFAIRSVASGLESSFRNLPKTLLEARVDALVLDQVDYGLGLVPMHLGMPYVHVSNLFTLIIRETLHFVLSTGSMKRRHRRSLETGRGCPGLCGHTNQSRPWRTIMQSRLN